MSKCSRRNPVIRTKSTKSESEMSKIPLSYFDKSFQIMLALYITSKFQQQILYHSHTRYDTFNQHHNRFMLPLSHFH